MGHSATTEVMVPVRAQLCSCVQQAGSLLRLAILIFLKSIEFIKWYVEIPHGYQVLAPQKKTDRLQVLVREHGAALYCTLWKITW